MKKGTVISAGKTKYVDNMRGKQDNFCGGKECEGVAVMAGEGGGRRKIG